VTLVDWTRRFFVFGPVSFAMRQIYHDVLVAALKEPAFDGTWLWGYTD
jgi:hypothetical protein